MYERQYDWLEMHGCITTNFTEIRIFFIIYWTITKTDILEKTKFYYDDLPSKYYSFSNFLQFYTHDKSKGCD